MKNSLIILMSALIVQYNSCMTTTSSLELIGHTAKITRALFDSTGKYAITIDENNILKVWDSKKGIELHNFHCYEEITEAGTTRNGKILFTILKNGQVLLWSLGDKPQYPIQPVALYDDPQTSCRVISKKISFSRDSRFMLIAITTDKDNTIELWDLESPEGPVRKASMRGESAYARLTAFSNSETLIATNAYKTINILQADGLKLLTTIPYCFSADFLKFKKSDTQLTIKTAWGHVKTWDLKKQQWIEPSEYGIIESDTNLRKYLGGDDEVVFMRPNDSFTRICTGYYGECRLWDPKADSFIPIDDATIYLDNPFNKRGDRMIFMKISDRTKAKILIDTTNKQSVAALSLALHKRAGAASPAQTLTRELFERIHKHLQKFSFM